MADRGDRLTRRARTAAALSFLVCGFYFAAIACRVPDIRERLHLDEATLGLALMSVAVGAIPGVYLAGGICTRFGSSRVNALMALVGGVFFLLLSQAPSLWLIVPCFIGFGFSSAAMDVAMNTNGVFAEKLLGRPIMSSLHGMFSLGGLSGAGFGWLTVRAGLPMQVHFLLVALASAAIIAWVYPNTPVSEAKPEHKERFEMPDRAVLLVGLIAFCAFLSEGSMGDWSAVYLRDSLQQSPSFSTLGYFAFTLSMTATRFLGDRILAHWGPKQTLQGAAAITFVGFGTALLVHHPWVSVVGCACVGLGMSIVAPITFGIGGRLGGDNPDKAISTIATIGYLGFLVGPGVIGILAKATSLRAALVLVVVLAALIIVLSRFAEPHHHPAAPSAEA